MTWPGARSLHLQCHFGLDTLSWARRGAEVTGLDFSAPAVEAARGIAAGAGLDAEFVEADVYDAAAALGGRALRDRLHRHRRHQLAAGHPPLGRGGGLPRGAGRLPLPERVPPLLLGLRRGRAAGGERLLPRPPRVRRAGTYADLGAVTVHNRTEEWQHTLGDIVSAITAAGLRLELLHEHDHTLSPRWGFLERAGHDTWRMPAGQPRIPLMFSLRAPRGRGLAAQVREQRGVVRGLRTLAVVAVDAARLEPLRERRREQHGIDPQAHLAVEVALSIVPPGEARLVRVELAEGIHHARLEQRGEALALGRGHVGGAHEGGRVVHVEIGGADVEVPAHHQRAVRQLGDPPAAASRKRSLST